MIVINDINISSNNTELTVFVTAPVGETFSTAKLWDSSNYASATDFTDLDSLLGNTQLESFTIPVATVGDTAFNGVYFLEFTTDLGTTRTVAVSNLTTYSKCLLDKVLKIDIVNCVPVMTNDCEESIPSDVNTINTFLEGLCYALETEDFLSAQKIELCLMKMCDACGCTSSTNLDNFNGTQMTSDAVVKY